MLDAIDINKVSPMMKQYIEIKNNNPEIIIFFRLGDFYEMFFDDAIKVSKILELTLTSKSAGLDERIPMCGIPYHAAESYLNKLTDLNYRVGICEQLEDAKNVKGLVKRGITRIVSKGTNFNESSLKYNDNNYMASITGNIYNYSICYIDITTGEVNGITILKNNLKELILSLNINEIITNDLLYSEINNVFNNFNHINVIVQKYDQIDTKYNYIYANITDNLLKEAIELALIYLTNTQMVDFTHLQELKIKTTDTYLKMNYHTKNNLELTTTLRNNERQYSLLWLLDKTKTAMGSRLLRQFINFPSTDEVVISKRLNIVEKLINDIYLNDDLAKYLNQVYDLERLCGRISLNSANPKDLIWLKKSLEVLPNINNIINLLNYDNTIKDFTDLFKLIDLSIDEDASINLKDGNIIKSGYNVELDELKDIRKNGKDFIVRFENEEREKTKIKSLKVGYNKIFGYYIEIPQGSIKDVKEEYGYDRKQTLANCERYISPLLKEKEAIILGAEEKIINLEYELFIAIREEIKAYIYDIQEACKIISELDVLLSFSKVSEENNYVRPSFNHNNEINIIDSRHPIVEKVIKDEFIKNDILMNNDTSILLITGPNMAGKSTYMRQLALIAIMSCIGCFIPAKSASIPIFDAIYTRIGASDDLVSGESTFMVEMSEANFALSNATKDSLILFDELGRGTATFDGIALAQAIIEYISINIGAKTLFSTHYHELTDLENNLDNLKNIHVSAYEENNNLTFLHKIKEGSIDKSYGINVAKLASLPNSLIKRASTILQIYEDKEIKRDIIIEQVLPLEFDVKSDALSDKIDAIDPNVITPKEALDIIYELKEIRKRKNDV